MSELYTHLIEDQTEIDAMLLRLQVLYAQSKPCRVIPFPRRLRGQTEAQAGPAHIIIYSDAIAQRLADAEAYASSYVSDEIKIHKLVAEQDKERSRRGYAKKCEEIERLLDLLAAPQCDGSIGGRFWAREADQGTSGEAGSFLAAEDKKALEAELKYDEGEPYQTPTDW